MLLGSGTTNSALIKVTSPDGFTRKFRLAFPTRSMLNDSGMLQSGSRHPISVPDISTKCVLAAFWSLKGLTSRFRSPEKLTVWVEIPLKIPMFSPETTKLNVSVSFAEHGATQVIWGTTVVPVPKKMWFDTYGFGLKSPGTWTFQPTIGVFAGLMPNRSCVTSKTLSAQAEVAEKMTKNRARPRLFIPVPPPDGGSIVPMLKAFNFQFRACKENGRAISPACRQRSGLPARPLDHPAW